MTAIFTSTLDRRQGEAPRADEEEEEYMYIETLKLCRNLVMGYSALILFVAWITIIAQTSTNQDAHVMHDRRRLPALQSIQLPEEGPGVACFQGTLDINSCNEVIAFPANTIFDPIMILSDEDPSVICAFNALSAKQKLTKTAAAQLVWLQCTAHKDSIKALNTANPKSKQKLSVRTQLIIPFGTDGTRKLPDNIPRAEAKKLEYQPGVSTIGFDLSKGKLFPIPKSTTLQPFPKSPSDEEIVSTLQALEQYQVKFGIREYPIVQDAASLPWAKVCITRADGSTVTAIIPMNEMQTAPKVAYLPTAFGIDNMVLLSSGSSEDGLANGSLKKLKKGTIFQIILQLSAKNKYQKIAKEKFAKIYDPSTLDYFYAKVDVASAESKAKKDVRPCIIAFVKGTQ